MNRKLDKLGLYYLKPAINLALYLYDHIIEYVEPIDILFHVLESDEIPINWLYDPLFNTSLSRKFDRNRTLSGANFKKAWAIIEKLQCKNVYIYAMSKNLG
ncbi:MAG: hypothetical protein K2Q34_07520 [Alphaproteobacteria bacterium]|nr:hypothetical protein [Alphaproteobacteria bacterium]